MTLVAKRTRKEGKIKRENQGERKGRWKEDRKRRGGEGGSTMTYVIRKKERMRQGESEESVGEGERERKGK